MMFFKWHERFSVSHPELDAQHRRFLETLNTLYAALQEHREPGALRSVLNELARYAREHFAWEENLLREVDYPGLDEQLRQHGFFRNQLAGLERAFQTPGGRDDLTGALHFMRDWFLHHILAVDRQYMSYLQNRTPPGSPPRP